LSAQTEYPTCAACGGAVWIIACIEDPEVIEKILAHLDTVYTQKGALYGLYSDAPRRPVKEFATSH